MLYEKLTGENTCITDEATLAGFSDIMLIVFNPSVTYKRTLPDFREKLTSQNANLSRKARPPRVFFQPRRSYVVRKIYCQKHLHIQTKAPAG